MDDKEAFITVKESNNNTGSLKVPSERDFHTEDNSTYWLPKDQEEQYRLTGQHFAIKELYQGNISKNVLEELDFNKGVSVLDVGCGSGAWIMDMITEYPNCTFKGCDMVEVTNERMMLPQCSFDYGNVLEKLPYADQTFDFVHMRLFILALKEEEWPVAIREILRVTKSGGMIQLCEFDVKMTGNEPVQKFLSCIHKACKARGQDPRIALKLEGLVLENEMTERVKTDYRSLDMHSNTVAAKTFTWDWIETARSMMPVLGPILGYSSKEEQEKYLEELRYGLLHSESYTCMNVITAVKI